MEAWPHQLKTVEDTIAATSRGERRILVTSPTGGGKTKIMEMLIEHYLAEGFKVVLYTNRKLLVEQTSRVLEAAGMSHGVRASGHQTDLDNPLQISSIQTENARVLKGSKWEALHDAAVVLVDEAHLQTGEMAKKVFALHGEKHAAIVGFTASPIGLGEWYESLVVAGTNSELRKCGALVPAIHYGPDEPDMKGINLAEGKDLTEGENRKAIMRTGIFGRVLKSWLELNPLQRPSILFAPGVPESIYFAEQFYAAGISAAHVDGDNVWWDGKTYKRERGEDDPVIGIMEASKRGICKVLCNRYVLREGINAPWLAHGILCTVFGALQSYLQSGGRLLRAHPGLETVVIQDHGGNWWRHGSLNADRAWRLDDTAGSIAGMRAKRLREKKCQRCKAVLNRDSHWCPACQFFNEPEPALCPNCKRVLTGPKCPCGWTAGKLPRARAVVQSDGTLKMMSGEIFKPRRITKRPDGKKVWERIFWGARKSAKWNPTFNGAMAYFAQKNFFQWPDPEWPLMPLFDRDFYREIKDVPMDRIRR